MLKKTIGRTGCVQCGTCCQKGGPALHRDDRDLIRTGLIGYHQLVTIRKGEPVLSPVRGRDEPAGREFIKLRGIGRQWACLFFDPAASACSIYAHRPQECRLLKCWDPAELLAVIDQDTISRRDIINPDDPILQLVAFHDEQCPGDIFAAFYSGPQPDKEDLLARLTEAANRDLAIRCRAVAEFGLALELEYFILGRPLFTQLAGFGITVREEQGGVRLLWIDQ